MAEANTLREYLVDELHDLVDAEQQLTRALPQMATSATTPLLRTAFEQHLKQTNRQLDRLRQALSALGEDNRATRCVGMRGLISEGSSLMRSTPRGALRDAMMITAAQKVEHYEIAAYGTARTYASVLGRRDVARLLDDTLQEEKATDLKLTEIAESTVNERAAEEWHRQSTGLVEQSAEWLGQTAGVAARGVRRAADAAGLSDIDTRQMANSLPRGVNEAAQSVADAAQTAVEQARQITRRTTHAAREAAADASARVSRARPAVTAARTTRRNRRKAGKKR